MTIDSLSNPLPVNSTSAIARLHPEDHAPDQRFLRPAKVSLPIATCEAIRQSHAYARNGFALNAQQVWLPHAIVAGQTARHRIWRDEMLTTLEKVRPTEILKAVTVSRLPRCRLKTRTSLRVRCNQLLKTLESHPTSDCRISDNLATHNRARANTSRQVARIANVSQTQRHTTSLGHTDRSLLSTACSQHRLRAARRNQCDPCCSRIRI
ncbi:hypothetical protein ABIF38_008954 [Bradyrhizobium japonicum]|uniref:Uncharacterized protein n=2 Tax=Bradyrhizobium elkanii TaxID=29448 RepID=A0ABV4EUF3_BRAEL|nr:hypothetical protein [Bradyrhizobium elkanii]